jgi:hypothetical protein
MEGNQMKMREALELCAHEMCKYCRKAAVVENLVIPCLEGCETQRIAKAALSAPPRQCDVGTAYEQSERMEKSVCSKHHGCVRCPLRKAKYGDCSLAWAQTPYDAERKGESDGV